MITLSIRPESTRVIEGGSIEGQNTFRGKVESLLFTGDAYEGVIKVGETSLITRIEVDANIKEGDEVGLHIYPGKCSVLY
jgi:iron(III) transport system ATP-binding protein